MTTIIPLNKTDNLVLTKINGITACSVQEINDTEIITIQTKINQNEKTMADLITAKQDASTKSKETKRPIFVDLMEDGECEVALSQTKKSIHAFRDGNEIELPEYKERIPKEKPTVVKEEKIRQPKTKKKMAKTAKKKVTTPVKKESTTGLIGKATTLLLSPADWKRLDKAVADGKGSIRDLASKGILKVI